jgi:hypothetical protein
MTTSEIIRFCIDISLLLAAIASAKIAHNARRDYQKTADRTEIEKLRDEQKMQAVEIGKLQTEIANLKEKTTTLFSSIKDGDLKIDTFAATVNAYMISQASKSDKTNQ